MDTMTLSRQLLALVHASPAVYVRLIPGLLDFTAQEPGAMEVSCSSGRMEIPFDPKNPQIAISLLNHALEDRSVMTWGFKDVATLARYHGCDELPWANRVWDIKVIEAFLTGAIGKPPADYEEACRRMALALPQPSWRPLYTQVLLPLIAEVVPAMESLGLLSDGRRGRVHPYYEVEGQRQGRMKAVAAFARGYNPHTMGKDGDLKPPIGEQFLLFDYKNMEVAMLAWLSKDRRLQAILDSGRDVYETIWWLLVDQKPSPTTRKLCKEIFLPVAYGMGEGAVAEKLGNLEASRIIMNAIHDRFSVSMGFLRDAQDSTAPNGLVRDHFGRPRIFEDRSHKIRNFVVQAPAAILCEERLVALHRAIGSTAALVFHVHDGYALTCQKSDSEQVFSLARATLEAESSLCPGLRLKIAGSIGDRLDALSPHG